VRLPVPASLPARLRVLRAPLGVDLRTTALFGLPGTNLSDALRVWNLQARLRPRAVVEIGNRDARQTLVDRSLDIAEARFVFRRDERERRPCQLCAGGASDSMNVVV